MGVIPFKPKEALISGRVETVLHSNDEPELFSFEWACIMMGYPLPKPTQSKPEGEKKDAE